MLLKNPAEVIRLEKERENKIEKRVELETRGKVEKEIREKVEKEFKVKIEQERIDSEKLVLEESKNFEVEQQQHSSHVFTCTPDKQQQQLPSYIDANTLEVSNDEYDMTEEIGSGSFSTVHKGIHVRSGRGVVIKNIKDVASNKRKQEKFAKELTKLQFLVHPGIPKVEAFYKSGKHMCVVFQDSNGVSVRSVMDDNSTTGKVPEMVPSLLPSELLKLTVRSIEILDYVHGIGNIVHYDIKPENILLCKTEYGLQIIDFGSAALLSSSTLLSTLNGCTESYASPEHLGGKDAAEIGKSNMSKIDVWSLGATLLDASCSALLREDYDNDDERYPYFCRTSVRTGTISFDDDDKIPWSLDTVLSKYFEIYPDAKPVWDAVDNDVKHIIRVCLTHDIAKRPTIRDITQMQSYQRLRNIL